MNCTFIQYHCKRELKHFDVPAANVERRKRSRLLVCNSVAQSVVKSVRGEHDEFVFVYQRRRTDGSAGAYQPHPVGTMNNTAWQRARREAGLDDLHVHDLRHTTGMRFREAGVAKETRSIILWHKDHCMTAHYSAAQVLEVRSALELIREETGRENRSLRSLAKQARRMRVPSVSLQQEETA